MTTFHTFFLIVHFKCEISGLNIFWTVPRVMRFRSRTMLNIMDLDGGDKMSDSFRKSFIFTNCLKIGRESEQ